VYLILGTILYYNHIFTEAQQKKKENTFFFAICHIKGKENAYDAFKTS
jgi:hypothetical protein